MKAHEETWGAVECGGQLSVLGTRESLGKREVVADVYGGQGVHDIDRAHLIAQAPAMARLLLTIQWSATYGHDETAGACPSCGWPKTASLYVEDEPEVRNEPPTFAPAIHPRGHWVERPGEHAADCQLAAVLRAAGVLP